MSRRYELRVVGITYNQIESGVYALVLQAEDTNRRIPIIIGQPEAQAIEARLQGITVPRPLTHDMMVSTLRAFGIELMEVEIRRLPTGVFAADLVFSDGSREHRIDSRSSDAVALAIRVGAPVFTSQEVLDEAGFDTEGEDSGRTKENRKADSRTVAPIEEVPVEELHQMMQRAIDNEDYETAAEIKQELERRNQAKL